jgi:hypothetical protein
VKQGFTVTPVSYSTQTIESLTKYLKSKNINDSVIKSTISEYEAAGVPESSINTYISTNKWPYSKEFTSAYLNSGNKTKIEDLNVPEEMSVKMLSKFYGNISLSSLRPLNLMCKTDASGNSIGEGIYTLKDGKPDEYVTGDDLLIKAPGFTFLKEECNPCDILNNNYDCPFSVPGSDKKPLLPNSMLRYVWNI